MVGREYNDALILDRIIKLSETKHLIEDMEHIRDAQDPLEDLGLTMDALRTLDEYGDAETALEALGTQRDNIKNELRALGVTDPDIVGDDDG